MNRCFTVHYYIISVFCNLAAFQILPLRHVVGTSLLQGGKTLIKADNMNGDFSFELKLNYKN